MEQIVPVNVRNSATGKVWYASPLGYGLLGKGSTPEEAIGDLERSLQKEFPEESFNFLVKSVDVSFPVAKNVPEFFEWMQRIKEGEPTNAVR